MKKWPIYLMVVLLMAGCAILAGCGQKKAQETSSPPPNVQEKGSSNELTDIMKSARGASDMSFEMVSTSTSSGQTVTVQGKYWVSGSKMRMETEAAGVKAITVVNAKGEVWMYNPADKTAIKLPAVENKTELPNQWSEENDLAAYKIVGHEKVNGYDCVVVTVSEDEGTSKMWLRKDIGMPVKMEAKSADDTMVIEYKNYQVGKQDAGLFEIPADAQVMDMSAMPDMSKMPAMPNQ